ncbi:IucA/IucC family protein [Streptomyces neyagawaensis]|nr:IucA/IucC family protein [Streptomyces neyagawaensis]MCL6731423.1 iron transporter [Streptomyces neyagawaensis]MDE1683453.1 IucA/IucC family protein [Streptomyces neyagawaensis]
MPTDAPSRHRATGHPPLPTPELLDHPDPHIAAQAAAVENLLRCWVREHDLTRPDDATLRIPLPATGTALLVPIHYWSPTGWHRFGFPRLADAPETAPAADAVTVAALLSREAAAGAGAGVAVPGAGDAAVDDDSPVAVVRLAATCPQVPSAADQPARRGQAAPHDQPTPHGQGAQPGQPVPLSPLTPHSQPVPHDGAAPRSQPVPHDQAAPRSQPVPHDQAAPRSQPVPHDGAAPRSQPVPHDEAAPHSQSAPHNQSAPPDQSVLLGQPAPLDSLDLVGRVADSARRVAGFIAERRVRPDDGPDLFLAAEQALVLGHPLHPTPKSREGLSEAEARLYSPESRGSFPLHWLAVAPSVLSTDSAWTERGRVVPAEQLSARLAGPGLPLPDGYAALPVHPWQWREVRHHPTVAALLDAGLLLDLGPHGSPWHPTSSVRTVHGTAAPAMLKLSLGLRITNSRRENLRKELHRGVEVHRLLRTGLAKQWQAVHPGFDIVRDPAWLAVTAPGGDPVSGLDVVIRHNPFGPADDACCVAGLVSPRPYRDRAPVGGPPADGPHASRQHAHRPYADEPLAAGPPSDGPFAEGPHPDGAHQATRIPGQRVSVPDRAPHRHAASQASGHADRPPEGPAMRSRLAEVVTRLAGRTGRPRGAVAAEWFLRYLEQVVRPVLWLDSEAGIALEAHQQNTVLLLDPDGWPRGGRYRDNQGYYFRESRRADLDARLPGIGEHSDTFVSDEVTDERFAYYLGINNVLGLIGAFGSQGLADERLLLAAFRRFLTDVATGPARLATPLPALLLDSPVLRCKANLLTRLNGLDELVGPVDTQSVYVTIANPLHS